MSRLLRGLTATAGVLLVAAGAWAEIQAPASAPALARSERQAKHLVWRVDKAGKTLAFLVGSVHVLTKESYPLPAVFDAAFNQTSTLVEEIDLGEAGDASALLATATQAIFTDGQTLRTVLDGATYARVEAKATAAGLPMMFLDRMKPWLVAVTLSVPDLQRAGFDPANGLDRYFYDRARAAARPVRGLETAAYQVERLNGLTMTVQVDMLRATLADVEAQVSAVKEIVDGWRTGDVETLERLLLQEFRAAPEVYQRLLVDRNRNWVPKLAECLPTAPCLVVVGAAHLLGSDGLVALLREAGFTLEQL